MTPGTRIGAFEIGALIGSGGTGEVYRARDTRLQRDVALKVLAAHHADDSHRLSRFKREALVLASLTHPRIATLFAIEESGPVTALVMELVEGDTLADRIALRRNLARGTGLPLAEALPIALQIAEALEAAHERGIVHRDLKPANIKVHSDGSVKVLDFGLANVRAPAGTSTATTTTITALAEAKTAMGTPGYMSPEQARGELVDHRTDVWAFGCVLYELLTGRPAFDGGTTLEILANVIQREPDLSALPADTSPAVRRLLRRALTKDVRTRLRDIGDAQLELADAVAHIDDGGAKPAAAFAPGDRRWRPALVALAGALISAVATWHVVRPAATAPAPALSRFELTLPIGAGSAALGRDIALSPDGTRLAIPSQDGLYVRLRDKLGWETIRLRDSPGAYPSFSPDGRWIAYLDGGDSIKRIAVTGGSPLEIARVSSGATLTWGASGIVFADVSGLYGMSDGGGTPQKLAILLGPGEQAAYPEVVAAGQSVLFTVLPTRANSVGAASVSPLARIDAVDLRTGRQTTIVQGGGRPRYVPTGHLLYGVGQTLFAVAFDADHLETRGDPVEVSAEPGSSEFAVSNDGTLAYISGRELSERELVWVDRRAWEESLGAPLRAYLYPRLSPDGRRVALDVEGDNRDIWIWNIPGRTLERFTADPTENALPAWSRDGLHLVFSSNRGSVSNVFWQASDGSGFMERLLESPRLQQPIGFTPDGRLLISEAVPGRGRDVVALTLDGVRRVEPVLEGEATEATAEVSPDGRWIAYNSDESGQFEVYVRPYPRTDGGPWKISAAGGRQPLWSPDGREVYYRDFTGALMAVPVTPSPTFIVGTAMKLLDGSRYRGGGSQLSGRTYDVARDGSRFLMIKTENPRGVTPRTVVITQNWAEELKARVPVR
jgi:serine/threonine-protein kinase